MGEAAGETGEGHRKSRSTIVLQPDGKNFLAWKTILPGILRGERYAWEVTKGTLKPPDVKPDQTPTEEQKKQKENYEAGNRAALPILINSVDPTLIVTLFYSSTDTISAFDFWRLVPERLSRDTGASKDLAINRLMTFKFDPSQTVDQNVHRFKDLMYKLDEMNVNLDRSIAASRLLNGLPTSWRSFKQAFNAQSSQDVPTLITQILSEADRLEEEKLTVQDTDALFTRMHISGRGRGARWPQQQRQFWHQRTERSSTTVCFKCGRTGHKQYECRTPSFHRGRGRGGGRTPQSHHAEVTEALMAEKTNAEDCEAAVSETTRSNEFLVDSGCTHHMVNSKDLFTTYQTTNDPGKVRVGSKQHLKIHGKGSVTLLISVNGEQVPHQLDNVLHVPKLRRNLFSVADATDHGFQLQGDSQSMQFRREDIILHAERTGNLFTLRANIAAGGAAETFTAEISSLQAIHEAMGHISKGKLRKWLARERIPHDDDMTPCTACLVGKAKHASYPSRPTSAETRSPGEVINTDLCQMPVTSLGGHNYFMIISDSYSKYKRIYFLKHKNEAVQKI